MLLRCWVDGIPYLTEVNRAFYKEGNVYFESDEIEVCIFGITVSEWSVLANDMFADNKLILPRDKYSPRVWNRVK